MALLLDNPDSISFSTVINDITKDMQAENRLKRKVFVYLTIKEGRDRYLLVFESHEEPGYEIPKGSVEPGEDLASAVHREVREESGLTDLEIIRQLGKSTWKEEEQFFFLARTPSTKREDFDHRVTGNDVDEGFLYQYTWLKIDSSLRSLLVQGCDRFVGELISAVYDE